MTHKACFIESLPISAVDYINKDICVLEVVSPVWPYPPLPSYVPHIQLKSLGVNTFNVETLGRAKSFTHLQHTKTTCNKSLVKEAILQSKTMLLEGLSNYTKCKNFKAKFYNKRYNTALELEWFGPLFPKQVFSKSWFSQHCLSPEEVYESPYCCQTSIFWEGLTNPGAKKTFVATARLHERKYDIMHLVQGFVSYNNN